MNRRIQLRVLAALLLLAVEATIALPREEPAAATRRNSPPAEEGPSSHSDPDEKSLGVVLTSKPSRPAEAVQVRSSYSQLIDPVNGLSTSDLVRYGLAHNGELRAARHMIAEARGRLRQSGLKPNPMVESSYQRGVTSTDNNLNLMAELPLELGGRRQARIGVVQRELEMREAETADFERRLAAEVRMKYADVIAAARNLKFTEDLLILTRDSHSLIQARVERGKSAPLEQNVVSVEVGQVDAIRINFQGKAEIALLDLKRVIGMLPEERLSLRGDFDTNLQPISQSDAVDQALRSRPDLAAARAAEELAKAQIEQARTEGKIDASVFASYMRQNMGFGIQGFNEADRLAPVQGIFHYVGVGVRLTLPVRNKNQGLIEAAQASLEAARSRRQFGELAVRNEVAAAYTRFERARQALAVYRDSVREQAHLNLNVIRQTYEFGQKSLLEYVAERRRYIDVETSYTEVLKEYFNSLAEIERAAASPVPSV
jgi:cobalt-zinc-cadmium efflux system outer membrane protein